MREALSRGTDCVYVQLSQYILTDEGRDEPYFLLLSLAPSCSNSGWRCTERTGYLHIVPRALTL